MNKHVKNFFFRGLMFGGFGPVIVGIIYAVLEKTTPDFSLTGFEVCLAIVSSYILAFIQAGASVFNQIEEWPLMKCTLCHFFILYVAYVACYIVNTWIPFKAEVVALFTGIFIVVYLIVWLTVFLTIRATSKRLNNKL